MSAEPPGEQGEITQFLIRWRSGDPEALNRLFPLACRALRDLARRQLRGRPPDQTLRTTALVHEAYLKLVDQTRANVQDRRHFFALASKAMRQILVDHARRRGAVKRGAGRPGEALDEGEEIPTDPFATEVLEVDEALDPLNALDERLGRLVEMRFFGGLSVEETAEILEVSPRTVKRDWQKARAFLYNELKTGDRP